MNENKNDSGADAAAVATAEPVNAPQLTHADVVDRLRLLARVHASNGGLTKMDTPYMRFTDRELAVALYAAVYRLEALAATEDKPVSEASGSVPSEAP